MKERFIKLFSGFLGYDSFGIMYKWVLYGFPC